MEPSPREHFGPHALIELYGCDLQAMDSLDEVYSLLDRLPELMGMTKISPPQVFRYKGVVPQDLGVTGLVFIAESHCSYHAFPLQDGFVTMDLYSCKDFDVDILLEEIKKTLRPQGMQCQLIYRGKHFPGYR